MAIAVDARGTGKNNATTVTVTIPGTKATDDLVVVALMSANVSGTNTWTQQSGTTGWTELFDTGGHAVWYKQISASEANPVFEGTENEWKTYSVLKISGHEDPATTAPTSSGTPDTGTDHLPDPPASTTPTSSAEHLWIATCGVEHGGTNFINAGPSGWTNFQELHSTGAGSGSGCGTAELITTSGSPQNPGTFTLNGGQNHVAETILVEVASGGAPTFTPKAIVY